VASLIEILGRGRVAKPAWRRRLARAPAHLIAALLCTQMLADCARRPIAPEVVAHAPINSIPAPQPTRAKRQSGSRECQLRPSGLGDTWVDLDDAAARNCATGHSAAGGSRS
jgi:hypothetical protein